LHSIRATAHGSGSEKKKLSGYSPIIHLLHLKTDIKNVICSKRYSIGQYVGLETGDITINPLTTVVNTLDSFFPTNTWETELNFKSVNYSKRKLVNALNIFF
jgi:hypothetical protein